MSISLCDTEFYIVLLRVITVTDILKPTNDTFLDTFVSESVREKFQLFGILIAKILICLLLTTRQRHCLQSPHICLKK